MHEKQIKILTVLAGVLLALLALVVLIEEPDEADLAADEDEESFEDLAPDVEAAGVRALELVQGPGVIRFERVDDSAWAIRSPMDAPADADAVEAFLDRMLRTELGEGIETTELAAFGLEPPGTTMTFEVDGGEAVRLEVGDDAPVGYRTYVRDSSGTVRATRDKLGPALEIDLADFRPKGVVEVTSGEVSAVELQHGAEKLRLERQESRWWTGPGNASPVDGERVEGLLAGLDALEAVAFPDGVAAPPEAWTLRLERGELDPVELSFGELGEDGMRLATGPLQARPVLVDDSALAALSTEASSWMSRRLMELRAGDLQRVELSLDGEVLTASRGANGWEPVAGEALVQALEEVRVDRSARVAADELDGELSWGRVEVESGSGEVVVLDLVASSGGAVFAVEDDLRLPVAPTELQRLQAALR